MGLLPDFFIVQLAFAPLPPPFGPALREIEVETSVNAASAFRLHFDLSRTPWGDFDALAFDVFRPLLPIRVSVSVGILPIPQVLINGYIRDVRLVPSNRPGASTLEVSGMDALGTMMTNIQQPAIWPSLPDSEVVRAIFARYAIAPTFVFPTPPTRTLPNTTTTQREPDSSFVRRLALRNAYEWFIQPDPVAGLDQGHFHPPMIQAPPQGVLSIDFGSQTNLDNFNVDYQQLQPSMVTGMTVDPMTRSPIPVTAPMATEFPMGMEPTLLRPLPPPIERWCGGDAANPGEAMSQAMAQATESSRAIRARGEVDGVKFNRPLLPGLPVLVRGAGRQHSGLYYVTAIAHRISRGGYTQTFQAMRNAVGLTGAEVFIDPLAAVG